MSDYNKLNEDPVLYNKLYQGGVNYSGVDKVSEGVIKKSEIIEIVWLSILNGYYIFLLSSEIAILRIKLIYISQFNSPYIYKNIKVKLVNKNT